MATCEEKEIAKEILIAMINNGNYLIRKEYPETKTVAEMIGIAYKEILSSVSARP